MHDTTFERIGDKIPVKPIRPIAVISYEWEGRTHRRFVYLEIGGQIDTTRLLKWLYHQGVTARIEWVPEPESAT